MTMPNNRRQFLTLNFSNKKPEKEFSEEEKNEIVKMLGKDGKLVEVSKYELMNATKRKSATSSDIMEWINKD